MKTMERDIDSISFYIKELRNGSHQAFNVLYDIYADQLFSFVFVHTKSRMLSEDIVQDTFLKLWINRKNISTDGSFKSLLYTICKNKIVDVFRTQINKVELDLFIEIYDQNDISENEVYKKMDLDDLSNILKMSKTILSDRELEVFNLSREKGKNIREIAKILCLSEQTIKNILTSSLKKIRLQLSKYFFII